MESEIRFRFTPRIATPEEIQAANALWRARGGRSELGTDAEEAALLARTDPLTDTRARLWVRHPDERVPLALLHNRGVRWESRRGRYIVAALVARGLVVNEEEGLLWNPLLDHLSILFRHRWGLNVDPGLLEEDFPFRPEGFEEGRWAHSFQRVKEHLRERLREAPDARLAEACLQARSSWVREQACGQTPEVTEPFWAAAAQSEDLLLHLIANLRLAEGQVAEIRSRAEADLARGMEERFLRRSPVYVLQTLVRHGRVPGGEVIELLLGKLVGQQDPRYPYSLQSTLRHALREQVRAMTTEQIRRYVEKVGVDFCPLLLVQTAETPLEVLREVARKYREPPIQEWLAKRADACRDPEVSGILSRVRRPQVQEAVLKHGTGEAFRTHARRELEGNPRKGLERLQSRVKDEGAVESLQPVDLAPVFQSPDPSLRESALGVLGRMRPAPPACPVNSSRR